MKGGGMRSQGGRRGGHLPQFARISHLQPPPAVNLKGGVHELRVTGYRLRVTGYRFLENRFRGKGDEVPVGGNGCPQSLTWRTQVADDAASCPSSSPSPGRFQEPEPDGVGQDLDDEQEDCGPRVCSPHRRPIRGQGAADAHGRATSPLRSRASEAQEVRASWR